MLASPPGFSTTSSSTNLLSPDRRRHTSVGRASPVSSARLLWGEPPFRSSGGRTYAQKAGLRYEAKVLDYLRQKFPTTLVSPWIEYGHHEPYSCLCQPDAIIINQPQRLITIAEVKYTHTLQAYKQLKLKYLPVCENIFRAGYRFNLLEITRRLDPAIRYPVTIEFIEDLEKFLSTPTSHIGVYTWR